MSSQANPVPSTASKAGLTQIAFCFDCGSSVPPKAKFCMGCGRDLWQQEAATPSIVPPCSSSPDENTTETPVVAKDEADAASMPNSPAQASAACRCGYPLPGDALYCHRCGVRVAEDPLRYRLTVITAQGQSIAHEVGSGEVSIGKDSGCDLVIRDDDYVSRRHARLMASSGSFCVEDTGSSNGTCLRVKRPILLEPGDEIVVGTTVVRLEEAR